MSGRLIYVVGASGSGKDTLLAYARERLAGESRVCFAHRYITRAAHAGGENHIALTPEEFAARRAAKLFAMHWSSHGHQYGIGIEINLWLVLGLNVVVNGSREYLPEARRSYPNLLPVWIEVSTSVLRERLLLRGREDAQAIERRLQRHHELQDGCPLDAVRINNDGTVQEAGERLLPIILHGSAQASQDQARCA